MRRLLSTLATLAPLALAAHAGAASAGCAPAGAHVAASAGAARLYTQDGVLYGCLEARTTRLGSSPTAHRLGATRVALFALSPRYAGIDTVAMGVDTFASTVAVVDLSSGRTLARAAAATPVPRPESFITVGAIAIDPHGTIAWIASRSAVGAFTPIYEVRTLTRTGTDRLLASGPKIDPHSLALEGETLDWRTNGATHSERIG